MCAEGVSWKNLLILFFRLGGSRGVPVLVPVRASPVPGVQLLDRMEHEYRAFEDAGPSERNDDTAASTLTRLRGAALDAGGNSAAAVTAIQLERLAAIIGVSMAELQGGLQRTAAEGGTLHASGVVARPAEQIAFEPVAGGTSDSGGVTTALLSVAARPSALDSAACPKALVDLGGQPVLAHVLSQLHAGGVRRVVLSCCGAPPQGQRKETAPTG
ncbi:hypothetical protein EMIHUDRAFT_214895 [Emiliania huxleyi CCMP1516]|uniref:MobA-like NTP transferase domain-containing protein n=2 Tax=Emiliania huxleyi TaxID=2903 RepID=A0A0D3IIK5_EMIH1|nr:hypothetical protein EMIHUDRAFT_214895 [Emiliania huxleyi CCMP1516]EOD11090.1 hypothetical protein EMIHUDRAFT_214895 [Emiliania huxleyi CCMP1516]|eukprot:XP_005763519.1 hypothetical protein EMIHUDRAFT_214895 [Emiliania huxleyi CCMP1516]